MPVEIRELVIRVVVGAQPPAPTTAPAVDYQQLVRDCVEQVLRVLKRERER